MDIYSAEVQVKKLLNYVMSLSDSKTRMYQKSKDRLKELAGTCNQVISVISEILQDEVLVDEQDEFGGSTSDFNAVLNSMEDQISELRQFLRAPRVSSTSTTSTNSKRQALVTYKHCLSSTAESDIAVVEAEGCAKMLWNWFNARFLSGPSSFKYNMKRFPGWIRDIVILYGYHFETHTLETFREEFYNWISTIPSGNNYAVPYEVYKFDKFPDPEFMTLSAVVIWDILLDYGLRDLCCDASSELYPSEDCVYALVGSMKSSVMDPYQNYLYDPSILSKCNLTLRGVISDEY